MNSNLVVEIGTTVRLRDQRLAILLVQPFVCCDAQLQILQGAAFRDVPAICERCQSTAWWWQRDLRPMCRVCCPPGADWEFNLLPRATAAVSILDGEEAREGKRWMASAFETGDLDALQRIEGLGLVQEELRKTYLAYFERKVL